jgi:mono/diheme cytochrome c family protein
MESYEELRAMNLTTRDLRTWSQWLPILGFCACGEEVSPKPNGSAGPGAGSGSPTISAPLGDQPVPPTQAPPVAAMAGSAAAAAQAGAAGPSAAAAGSGAVSTTPPPTTGAVTFHQDIRPIVEARCVACHIEGGSGPFPLDSWDKLQPFKSLVVDAVKARRMPPWLADSTNCTRVRHDQRLTDAQLALFTAWEAGGFAPGNDVDFKPMQEEPIPVIGEPNLIIKAAQPEKLSAGREYYACLQVDTKITEDTWVTAMDVIPENPEYVHHAIVSLGGGSCSALGTTAENVYSYRPGSRTLVFEKGDAMLMAAGAVIAIQFHYNTKFADRNMTLPSDHSTYRLWTLPKGQKPERAIARLGNHDLSISIPVNAVDQKEGGTLTIGSEYARPGAEIIGISPHMHYLGQTFKETLRKADGSSVCLVDIAKWDQDWQLDYFYNPADYIKVTSRDQVVQVCEFSNRPEDQGSDPSGMPFTPQYTTFGEDTRQEMCLGYIWFRYPLNGVQ